MRKHRLLKDSRGHTVSSYFTILVIASLGAAALTNFGQSMSASLNDRVTTDGQSTLPEALPTTAQGSIETLHDSTSTPPWSADGIQSVALRLGSTSQAISSALPRAIIDAVRSVACKADDFPYIPERLAKLDLRKRNVFIDFEATGRDPSEARIIEVGVSSLDERGDYSRRSFFVRPVDAKGNSLPIPEEVSELTKITDDMVKDAPTFTELLQDEAFAALVFDGGGVPVAHNTGYDRTLFHAEVARLMKKRSSSTRTLRKRISEARQDPTSHALMFRTDLPWVDSLLLARRSYAAGEVLGGMKKKRSFSLGNLARDFGVQLGDSAHRADADAVAGNQILQALITPDAERPTYFVGLSPQYADLIAMQHLEPSDLRQIVRTHLGK